MSSGSYVVSFAGSEVTIDWRGATAQAIVQFLFHELSTGPAGTHVVRIESGSDADDEEICVRAGKEELYRGDSTGMAAVFLMDWTTHELAADCHAGPLFHAAAVAISGHGVMFPGESGNGKSTLTAWLACNGFDCLTDEMTCPVGEDLRLVSFLRPIHLKGSSGSVLNELGCRTSFDPVDGRTATLTAHQGELVPVGLLNRRNVWTQPALNLIVFPRYESGAPLRVDRLSKAETGLQLMKHAVNVRNLAGHGFEAITNIAERTPAYRLSYGNFRGVVEAIEQMLSGLLRDIV